MSVFILAVCSCSYVQGLTKTGDDYEVKAAHVELAERMRKVRIMLFLGIFQHATYNICLRNVIIILIYMLIALSSDDLF